MKFETTRIVVDAIKPYIKNAIMTITTERTHRRPSRYPSDLVWIDTDNHVGFEVFDQEILVFYFTDHCHFEDYTSELQVGEDDYVKRAISFLNDLCTYPIRHVAFYKGRTLSSEKYFFLYNDGREDECIGYTWYGLSKFINPFGKKSVRSTVWQFDKARGIFTIRQPERAEMVGPHTGERKKGGENGISQKDKVL